MKKNETPDNKNIDETPDKQEAKTLSRRKIIKNLIFAPIHISLFDSVINAQLAGVLSSGVKSIPGDRYPGIQGKFIPASRAGDIT